MNLEGHASSVEVARTTSLFFVFVTGTATGTVGYRWAVVGFPSTNHKKCLTMQKLMPPTRHHLRKWAREAELETPPRGAQQAVVAFA